MWFAVDRSCPCPKIYYCLESQTTMLMLHDATSEARLAASSGIPINACNEAPRLLFKAAASCIGAPSAQLALTKKRECKDTLHRKHDARTFAQKSFKLLPTHSNLPVDDLPLRRLQAQDASRLRRSSLESESTHVEA